jgi:hypothetical protein
MKDYVIYHNPDKMGGSVTNFPACMIWTNKVFKQIVGSRVWLVTGEGKPRIYFLRSWFVVDASLPGIDRGYKTKLIGKQCQAFDPMVLLSDQDWFEDFKRQQLNFHRGLQPTKDEFVHRLLKIAIPR